MAPQFALRIKITTAECQLLIKVCATYWVFLAEASRSTILTQIEFKKKRKAKQNTKLQWTENQLMEIPLHPNLLTVYKLWQDPRV